MLTDRVLHQGSAEQREGWTSGSRPYFYFDWDPKYLRLKCTPPVDVGALPEELQSHPRGGVLGAGSQTVDNRLGRRDRWTKYGFPMHFLTLEFDDISAEMAFQRDLMRSLRRWVAIGAVAAMGWNLCHALAISAARRWGGKDVQSVFETTYFFYENAFASVMYGLRFLQGRFDRGFVNRNFQEINMLWAIIIATASLALVQKVGLRTCEETLVATIVVIFLVFRLRFYYYLLCLVYLAGGAYVISQGQTAGASLWRLLVICLGFGFVSYTLEVMSRKDFVQVNSARSEERRSERLLRNLLPASCVRQLGQADFPGASAQGYEQATVLFADIVSFASMSSKVAPFVLVDFLDGLFGEIDKIASESGVEKVKTFGSSYMAAAGLPTKSADHARLVARFGLQLLAMVARGDIRDPVSDQPIEMQLGVHTGPCVAGVVGPKRFAFDVWGDAPSTAALLKAEGRPMRLHCSEATHELVHEDLVCEAREPMEIEGRGLMRTYFVLAEKTGAGLRPCKQDN